MTEIGTSSCPICGKLNHKCSNNQDYEYGYYEAIDHAISVLQSVTIQEQEKQL